MKRLVFIFSFCFILCLSMWITPTPITVQSFNFVDDRTTQSFDQVQTDGTSIYASFGNMIVRWDDSDTETPSELISYNTNEKVLGMYVDDRYLVVITKRLPQVKLQIQPRFQHGLEAETDTNNSIDDDTNIISEPSIGDSVVKGYAKPETNVYLYQKDDIKNLVHTYRLEGELRASKQSGDTILFVLHSWHHDPYFPEMDGGLMDPCIGHMKPSEFVILATLNLSDLTITQHAYRGRVQQVLITSEHVYVTETNYPVRILASSTLETIIHKFKYTDGIKLIGCGTISGELWLPNRMDEYKEELRMITTSYLDNGSMREQLFVLDRDLNVRYRIPLKGLESIDSVGFYKNVIYLSSAKRMGVVDISKQNPKYYIVKAHEALVKVLFPFAVNTLIGIGYDENSQSMGKVTVTSYQIKNGKPKHSLILFPEDYDSDTIVLQHSNALLLDEKRNLIGLPIVRIVKKDGHRNTVGIQYEYTYVVIQYDAKDGFNVVTTFTHVPNDEQDRSIHGVFVNNRIYVITRNKRYLLMG